MHFSVGIIISEQKLIERGYIKDKTIIPMRTIDSKDHIVHNIVEEMLEPYEEKSVEPYVALNKQEFIAHMKDFTDKVASVKEEYNFDANNVSTEDFKKLVNDFLAAEVDEEENIISTYNPKSKWDWWVIGGRYSGNLQTKNKREVSIAFRKDVNLAKEYPEKQVKDDYKEYKQYGDETYETFKKFAYSTSFYALLDKDGWKECIEKRHPFDYSLPTDEQQTKWNKYMDNYLEEINPNDLIVVVDCHI